jgi:hypothetical protein
MLQLKTKKELSQEAFKLARSFEFVRYRSITYMPVDYETRDNHVTPSPERTIWVPLNRDGIRRRAAEQFDTMFATESELSSFDFMVAQSAHGHYQDVHDLLVRTDEGLRVLDGTGAVRETDGSFVPNTLLPALNTDPDEKARVLGIITEWVDGEEEAHSLLRHLATALAPGWSAVKYVLLLGGGRNGKSTLIKMLNGVFGSDNISNVTRQQISELSPVVTDLNGKLLNLIYDGPAVYLKDSGAEKSLIAGEPYSIRRLYESNPTVVQTNALFVEGLQHEPKSKDKSTALQKRLMRFYFPNVYPLDLKFEERMLREDSLGAFLSLLIDHYVQRDDVAEALAPTDRAMELQLEHMFANSLGLQFIKHLEEHDPLGAQGLVGQETTELALAFAKWRLKENDLGQWAEPDVLTQFAPLINTERKSKRVSGAVRKIRVVTGLKTEALAFIESLKGDMQDDDILALVED